MSLPAAIRALITVAFMGLVAVLSLTPDSADVDSAFVWLVHTTPSLLQKTLHVGVYATLTILWGWTLASHYQRRWLAAAVIAIVYGAVMEWLQAYVPGRFGSAYDVVLNGAGAAAGALIAHLAGGPGQGSVRGR